MGKGLFAKDTQAYLDFIPEKQTDFIFSILGEAFGFVGVLANTRVLLYSDLPHSECAREARDSLGTYIVMGILAVFFFHVW